jgi:hypothetical protein
MDIKRKLVGSLLLGLLLAASLAHAQRPPGGGGMGRGGPHQGMRLGPGPGGGQGMMMAPGSAPDGERRLNWVNEQGEDSTPRQRPRMSREERQELRREIHDAGRDLYPRRRQH